MTTRQLTVGVIGVGRMGGAMASTLARSGFDLTVWNRDQSKARELAREIDVVVADSPGEVARTVDVVLTSLADDRAVESVYLGDDGVVSGMGPHDVAVDTSTIDPLTVATVGEAIDAAGGMFLDCPVSGSVSSVEAGSLTIMAGGEPAQLETVRPILDTLASQVILVGKRGAGAAAKLAVNALVHGLNIALAEALVLAERAGVARSTAYDVFAGGAGGAPFVQYKRQAYEHPEDAVVAFSLDLVAKDLELITRLGARVGAPLRQAMTGLELVEAAIESGYGDHDLSAIAEFLRKEAG